MDPELTHHLRRFVLPLFRGAPPELHPWWWPLDEGDARTDWIPPQISDAEVERLTGLSVGQVVRSLQAGDGGRWDGAGGAFSGFRGYWGVGERCGVRVVVVTRNPSQSGYPNRAMATMARRLRVLGLADVHVTNVFKRRGGELADGDDERRLLRDFVEELVAVAWGGRPLLLCPNRTFADEFAASGILRTLGARSVTAAVAHPAPLQLYSQWDPGDDEVLASWRAVLP